MWIEDVFWKLKKKHEKLTANGDIAPIGSVGQSCVADKLSGSGLARRVATSGFAEIGELRRFREVASPFDDGREREVEDDVSADEEHSALIDTLLPTLVGEHELKELLCNQISLTKTLALQLLYRSRHNFLASNQENSMIAVNNLSTNNDKSPNNIHFNHYNLTWRLHLAFTDI